MAIIMGFGGSVTMPAGATNIVANFFEWTCDIPHDAHDVSNWTDATNARQHLGGGYHLTGQARAYFHGLSFDIVQHLVEAGTPTAGFVLASTGATELLTFAGLVTNLNQVMNKIASVPVQTISFISSGDVVPTNA